MVADPAVRGGTLAVAGKEEVEEEGLCCLFKEPSSVRVEAVLASSDRSQKPNPRPLGSYINGGIS